MSSKLQISTAYWTYILQHCITLKTISPSCNQIKEEKNSLIKETKKFRPRSTKEEKIKVFQIKGGYLVYLKNLLVIISNFLFLRFLFNSFEDFHHGNIHDIENLLVKKEILFCSNFPYVKCKQRRRKSEMILIIIRGI
jgi:hypothetical protein